MLKVVEGVKIISVDGKAVRENKDMDFIAGGHYYRYHWIPKNEVWIDDSVSSDEVEPTIVHELYERSLMKEKRMSYNNAHVLANRKELRFRRRANFG